MKSINRLLISEDYITLIFVFGVVLLFLMKAFNARQLYGFTVAFFTKGFVEKNAEESTSFFNLFYILLHLFCAITLSLTLHMFFAPNYFNNAYTLLLVITPYFLLFFLVKKVIAIALLNLFQIKKQLNYLYHSKNGYFYSSCIILFPFLILYQYTLKSKIFLIFILTLVLIFRLFLIFKNNKKVITKHLFYFILYFCTFELAPLLVIYKTINLKSAL